MNGVASGDWRSEYERLSWCPWRGAGPLTCSKIDRKRLVNREDDVVNLGGAINGNKLLVVTAASGVGKSSFLNAGLFPELHRWGSKVLVANNWHLGPTDFEEQVKTGVEEFEKESKKRCPDLFDPNDLTPWDRLGVDRDDPWKGIDEKYGARAVLILDQFEELIRHRRTHLDDVVRFVKRMNALYDIRIVISLRVEFEHSLQGLMTAVQPFSLYRYVLPRRTDMETVTKIIDSGEDAIPLDRKTEGGPIEPKATDGLLELWEREIDRSDGPGLLHLQGTLHALYHRASERAEGPAQILLKDVEWLVNELGAVGDAKDGGTGFGDQPEDIFSLGLQKSAEAKIELCMEACRKAGVNKYLVEGARGIVQRAVPLLSKGGYKVAFSEWDLVRHATSRQRDVLLPHVSASADEGKSAFDAFRTGAVSNSELGDALAPTDDVLDYSTFRVATHPCFTVRSSDPVGISAGPMFGMHADDILVEEMRRAALAMDWLRTTESVRVTATDGGERVLSLIHDGFGVALERWVDVQGNPPEAALLLVTAARGETFDWAGERDESGKPTDFLSEFDGKGSYQTIVNLRWRDCTVRAAFRRVIFANCDFRGTLFDNCRFEGVAFVNCLLDNVTFSGCRLEGETEALPNEFLEDRAPSFKVPGDRDETVWFAMFQGLEADLESDKPPGDGSDGSRGESKRTKEGEWFSDTSGVPARPAHLCLETPDVKDRILEWKLPKGGMAMVGGRVSSLRLYRCEADEKGEVAFYHVQGSGLEIVEHEEGTISIVGAALMGLSLSRDPDEFGDDRFRDENTPPEDAASSPEPKRLILQVQNSTLIDVTLGNLNVPGATPKTGHGAFDNCRIWGLINANAKPNPETEGIGFAVKVTDSAHWRVLNAQIDASSPEAEDEDVASQLPDLLYAMSFHLRPEAWARPEALVRGQ